MSKLSIKYTQEDLFKQGDNTLYAHACNCKGSWSAGVAHMFALMFPDSYEEYKKLCNNMPPSDLIGNAVIIAVAGRARNKIEPVGCLFTSVNYGKYKDTPKQILEYTYSSFTTLLGLIDDHNKENPQHKIKYLRMPKINSGYFNVPWENTEALLKSIDVTTHDIKEIAVCVL